MICNPNRRKPSTRSPAADGNARIDVIDTGRGIGDEELDALFLPFERGRESEFRDGRVGLGLALSKQLIVEMGGAIGVETKVGVGSRFWIELPLVTESDE